MKFQPTDSNPNRPVDWPYGIPFDPKYVYQDWGANVTETYTPQAETAPGGFGLDELLAQRAGLIDYRVRMIEQEIQERRDILERNFYTINLDQCCQRNIILLRGEDLWDKYRFKLEQDILGLEENKRREESAYFRDLLFLKKELRDALIEHKEEAQRARLLND